MKHFLKPVENAHAICFASYIVPPLVLLMITSVSLFRIGFVAAAAIWILAGMIASRGSRLRFHAAQAFLLSAAAVVVLGLAYWIMIGFDRDRIALNGGTYGFVATGQLVVVGGALFTVFAIAYLYAAIKACVGRDVRLPLVGSMAVWVAEATFAPVASLKKLLQIPSQIAQGEIRLAEYQTEMIMVAVLTATLVFAGPEIFSRPPPPPPPVTIKLEAIVKPETFVGFPWGIDDIETKRLTQTLGWKTGDYATGPDGLACRAFVNGYPTLLRFFYHTGADRKPSLGRGFITIKAADAPIGLLYQQLHKNLTDKYGPTSERGFPPWRTSGSAPYQTGYGSLWQITNEMGQSLNLYLALALEKKATASADDQPTTLLIRMENLQQRYKQ